MTIFQYTMKKVINYIIIFFLIVLMLLIGSSNNTLSVYADSIDITKTSVRDDLKSMDEDKLSYLSDEEFIFIGMSQYYDKDNNLRTYLYANIPYDISTFDYNWYATISTSVMDENYNITEDFKLYPIVYVNNEETWYKLEVLDLPNLEETTRRYYIQDLRVYEEVKTYADVVRPGIPDEGGGGNLDDDTSTPSDECMFLDEVSKVYIFNGITNNQIKVYRQEIETITITEKEIGLHSFGEENGWYDFWGIDNVMKWNVTYTDSWYVFFNTDKTIDELYEIDVTFKKYDYQIQLLGGVKANKIIDEETIDTIKNGTGDINNAFKDNCSISYYDQEIVTKTPGKTPIEFKDNWWGQYEIDYEELDNIIDLRKYDVEKDGNPFVFTEQAKKYTWGVNFLNTSKTTKYQGESIMGVGHDTTIINGTAISNTAILRLKYRTGSEVHNAYAVDVPTDDFNNNTELNENDDFEQYKEWFEKLVMLVGILILVVLLGYLAPIFKIIINVLSNCIKWSLKGVGIVITAPFKLIGSLFKTKRKR